MNVNFFSVVSGTFLGLSLFIATNFFLPSKIKFMFYGLTAEVCFIVIFIVFINAMTKGNVK